ncbi:MAG: SpoIIE family protein phosphatase [Oscillospiraceae bacterium]|nr:SpoIIE family protein phosphatase [Oscillospiraceae bacterium]
MDLGGQGRSAAGLPQAGALDARFLVAGRCALYLLLGMSLACARVFHNGAPFGMAMVACAGAGISGVFALIGASLGYLIGGGIEWGVRYIAASVLVYTIAFVFHELEVYRGAWFMPAAAGLVMGLTGWLGSFSVEGGTIPLVAELLLETTLAFAGAFFFRDALDGSLRSSETAELRHSVSLMLLASCVLMSLSRLVLFETVSIGRFLALLLVMTSANKGGMLTGATVGTVLGLAMDAAGEGPIYYSMAYSFAGLLSGVFSRHGRVLFVLSFVLAGAVTAVCAWDGAFPISALFESFCASVIFMLLPASLLRRAGVALQCMERGCGESGLRRYEAVRVRKLSEAYGELFETVRRNVAEPCNDENIARIFDRAADAVCVSCKFKNRCWNAEYLDTLNALNDATRAMIEHGSLELGDVPQYFRDKCRRMPAFVTAVNGELRGMSYRRQLRTRLSENRTVAWGQFADMSQMLAQISGELGSLSGADPHAERRLLRYLRSLEIDADAAVYRDGSGRLRVVIESGRLAPLLREGDYLEKLSEIVGARLCEPIAAAEDSARLELLEAEPLAVSVGIAALKKKGEKVSGDRGTYFKTDAGVLCVILSDGMGCGDEAAEDSRRVVGILEKFLRAGVDPAVAMRILNSVLLLRDAESWGFATVDLMCVDLFSGETCFYKYGAAPSYVQEKHSIRRVKGETLAAGLSAGEGTAPDLVRMRLKPGCTALIASDGVIADAEDAWLRAILLQGFEDMKALARAVLKEAEKLYGADDDMTVVAVRVEERK